MKTSPPKATVKVKARIIKHAQRFNFLGLLVALVFFCFSVLPSLLPRPWLYQSLISGISIAIGYGIGTLLSTAVRWTFQYEPPSVVKKRGWQIFGIVGPMVFVTYFYLGSVWQNEVHKLVGASPPEGRHFLRTFFFTLTVSMAIILTSRIINRFNRLIITKLDKYLPRRVSIGLGTALVGVFLWWLLS